MDINKQGRNKLMEWAIFVMDPPQISIRGKPPLAPGQIMHIYGSSAPPEFITEARSFAEETAQQLAARGYETQLIIVNGQEYALPSELKKEARLLVTDPKNILKPRPRSNIRTLDLYHFWEKGYNYVADTPDMVDVRSELSRLQNLVT